MRTETQFYIRQTRIDWEIQDRNGDVAGSFQTQREAIAAARRYARESNRDESCIDFRA